MAVAVNVPTTSGLDRGNGSEAVLQTDPPSASCSQITMCLFHCLDSEGGPHTGKGQARDTHRACDDGVRNSAISALSTLGWTEVYHGAAHSDLSCLLGFDLQGDSVTKLALADCVPG